MRPNMSRAEKKLMERVAFEVLGGLPNLEGFTTKVVDGLPSAHHGPGICIHYKGTQVFGMRFWWRDLVQEEGTVRLFREAVLEGFWREWEKIPRPKNAQEDFLQYMEIDPQGR